MAENIAADISIQDLRSKCEAACKAIVATSRPVGQVFAGIAIERVGFGETKEVEPVVAAAGKASQASSGVAVNGVGRRRNGREGIVASGSMAGHASASVAVREVN